MAKNTSISLGEHFETFINSQLSTGRFHSASEVIRAGLRLLENNEIKLKTLREHLAASEAQADKGEFADYRLNILIAEMDAEYDANQK
jgi:antitoxin ParD1/3/4